MERGGRAVDPRVGHCRRQFINAGPRGWPKGRNSGPDRAGRPAPPGATAPLAPSTPEYLCPGRSTPVPLLDQGTNGARVGLAGQAFALGGDSAQAKARARRLRVSQGHLQSRRRRHAPRDAMALFAYCLASPNKASGISTVVFTAAAYELCRAGEMGVSLRGGPPAPAARPSRWYSWARSSASRPAVQRSGRSRFPPNTGVRRGPGARRAPA